MAAFLAHPLEQTLGMLIYSFTLTESTGDSRAFIYVFSTILMIISGITIYIVYGIILADEKPKIITRLSHGITQSYTKLRSKIRIRIVNK